MLITLVLIIILVAGLIFWVISLFDTSEAEYRAEQEFKRVEDKNNYCPLDYSQKIKENSFGCYWIGNFLRH